MNREIDLSETCYGRVRDLQYDLTVLPWGATEPHNLHLPYLTDCILAHDVAVDAARKALETCDVRCMVLPPVNMGSQNPGQRELPFCIHARYETQKAILTDIASSLRAQGMRRLVIVNGHGGNCFKNMIRDLAVEMPDMLIAVGDWYTACPTRDFFDEPGDHADELETSVMMYYHPELVNLAEAGSGASKPFAARMLNEKVAWVPRDWRRVSQDTGIGNPAKASPGKGRRFAEAVAGRFAELFCELVRGPVYRD
ncbi:MAG: creatininase family protein [Alistipes senegalensis]|nr:creatininase family protein [Alistipes senegalensis]